MLNKPKYNIFSNTKYALQGFWVLLKFETSFKFQLLFLIILCIIILFLNINYEDKIKLVLSSMLPIYAEIINSAIERCVDLVTKEYNEIAKQAKDIGAFLVFISFLIATILWIIILL